MQQDFLSKNKELLSSLMEASDRLPLPIVLVDQELLQCWENQYLKKHYPFLCSKDNVLSLLQGYDVRFAHPFPAEPGRHPLLPIPCADGQRLADPLSHL